MPLALMLELAPVGRAGTAAGLVRVVAATDTGGMRSVAGTVAGKVVGTVAGRAAGMAVGRAAAVVGAGRIAVGLVQS